MPTPVTKGQYCLCDAVLVSWFMLRWLSLGGVLISMEHVYYESTRGLPFTGYSSHIHSDIPMVVLIIKYTDYHRNPDHSLSAGCCRRCRLRIPAVPAMGR